MIDGRHDARWYDLDAERFFGEDLQGAVEVRLAKTTPDVQKRGMHGSEIAILRSEGHLRNVDSFLLACALDVDGRVLAHDQEVGEGTLKI